MSLGFVAVWMVIESGRRLLRPVPIAFGEALPIAVLGLAVNVLSLKLLEHDDHPSAAGGGDHNWRAADPHVMADALTSILAITALLAGRSPSGGPSWTPSWAWSVRD